MTTGELKEIIRDYLDEGCITVLVDSHKCAVAGNLLLCGVDRK